MLDMVVFKSELNVYSAIVNSYEKAYVLANQGADTCIIESCIFVESGISDVSSAKKKVGIIKRLINVIRNLITRLAKFVKRKFGFNNHDAKSSSEHPQDNAITKTSGELRPFDKIIQTLEFYETTIDNFGTLTIENRNLKCINGKSVDIPDIPYDFAFNKISQDQFKTLISMSGKIISKIDNRVDTLNPESDGEMIDILKSFCDKINYVMIELSNAIMNNEKESNKNWLDEFKTSDSNCIRMRGSDVPFEHLEEFNSLVQAGITLRTTKSYAEYSQTYNNMLKTLGFSTNSIILPGSLDKSSLKGNDPYFLVRVRKQSDRIIKVRKGMKLYHTTGVSGLTALNPSFRTPSGADSLYPNNRVYFFIDNPGNRALTANTGKFKLSDNEHVYQYTGSMNVTLHEDSESSTYRKAVYIITDSPLPVKEVTEQFIRKEE